MKLESRSDKIVVHQVMKGGSIEKHGKSAHHPTLGVERLVWYTSTYSTVWLLIFMKKKTKNIKTRIPIDSKNIQGSDKVSSNNSHENAI